jgi:NAD(P)-dependent dehydrogenase (short-subunit alcohol dehydrogenase family)
MTTKKIALITGANKGIGKEIARQLGAHNYTVIVAARDDAAGQNVAAELKAAGADVVAIKLDVVNPDHIASSVAFVTEKFGTLDLLVNNAGVALEWNAEGTTAERIRQTFEVNALAPWAVTEAFSPLLQKSSDARVINHSSILGSIGSAEHGWSQMGAMMSPGYSMSKAALNMLTLIQAKNFADKGVLVTAAHPGWVKTELGSEAAPMEITDGAKTVVGLATIEREKFPTATLSHMGERLPW